MAREGGSTDATGTVKLTGDSSDLERALTRSGQKTAEFDGELRKLDATSKQGNLTAQAAAEAQRKYALQLEINRARVENMAEAQRKANAESQRAAAAQAKAAEAAQRTAAANARAGASMQQVSSQHGPNMAKTLERVGFAAHQVVGQTTSLNGALQGVLGTMGPWGIAIGAAVGTLLHFASAEGEAAKKTREHNDELRKQAGLRREAAQDFATTALLQRSRLQQERQEKAEEKARQQVEINHREEREFNEEQIVHDQSRGKSAEAYLRLQAELHEQTLREQAAVSGFDKQRELTREADRVAHEEKLRRLEVEGRHEKELTEQKKKQLTLAQEFEKLLQGAMKRTPVGNSPSFGRTGQDTLYDIEAAGGRAANVMPGRSLSGAPAIMRDPNAAAEAEQQRNNALRAVELERAQEREFDLQAELGRIDREKQAQMDLLSFKEQVAEDETERLAVRDQQRQVAHEAELSRIAAEQTAQQKAAAAQVQVATTVTGVLGSVTKIGQLAAEASGKSAAKRARAAQIAGGIEALTIGALEVVKAAAAYASWNIPQGVAHTAAAAVAFTEGGLMLAGRIGGTGGGGSKATPSGNAGGFGGGAANGGGNSLPTGSNSQIPGSAPPQQSSSSSSPGHSVVFNGPVHLYGTPHREVIRAFDEGLADLESNRRRKSA